MRAISRCDSCDNLTLRFVCPRSTRERDGIAAKLLRCGIASEALRRNMPLSPSMPILGQRKGGEHRRGEGCETFLARKWVLRRISGCFLEGIFPSKNLLNIEENLLRKEILSHPLWLSAHFLTIVEILQRPFSRDSSEFRGFKLRDSTDGEKTPFHQ